MRITHERPEGIIKNVLKGAFKVPSTRAGRIRLAVLALYTGLTVAFPGVPQAINLGLKVVGEFFR